MTLVVEQGQVSEALAMGSGPTVQHGGAWRGAESAEERALRLREIGLQALSVFKKKKADRIERECVRLGLPKPHSFGKAGQSKDEYIRGTIPEAYQKILAARQELQQRNSLKDSEIMTKSDGDGMMKELAIKQSSMPSHLTNLSELSTLRAENKGLREKIAAIGMQKACLKGKVCVLTQRGHQDSVAYEGIEKEASQSGAEHVSNSAQGRCSEASGSMHQGEDASPLSNLDCEVEDLRNQLEMTTSSRDSLEGQLASQKEECKNLSSEISRLTSENKDSSEQIASLLQQLEIQKSDCNKLRNSIEAMTAESSSTTEKHRVLEDLLATTRNDVASEKERCKELESQITVAEDKMNKLKAALEAVDDEKCSLRTELEALTLEKDSIYEEKVGLASQVASLEAAKKSVEDEKEELCGAHEALQKEKEMIQQQRDKYDGILTVAKANLDKAKGAIKKKDEAIAKLKAKMKTDDEEFQKKLANFESLVASLRSEIAGKTEDTLLLAAKNAELKGLTSRQQIEYQAMEEAFENSQTASETNRKEASDLRDELASLQGELTILRQFAESKDVEFAESQRNANEQMESLRGAFDLQAEDLQKTKAENDAIRAESEDTRTQLETANGQLRDLYDKHMEVENGRAQLQTVVDGLYEQVALKNEENDRLLEKLDDFEGLKQQIFNKDEAINMAEQRILQLQSDLAESQKECSEHRKHSEDHQRVVAALNTRLAEAEEQWQQEQHRQNELFRQLEETLHSKENELSAANDHALHFKTHLKSVEKECAEQKVIVNQQKSEISDLHTAVQNMQNCHQQEIDSNIASMKKLEEEVHRKNDALNKANKNIYDLQSSLECVEKECGNLRSLSDKHRTAFDELLSRSQEAMNQNQQELERNRVTIKQLEEDIRDKKESLGMANTHIADLQSTLDHFREECSNLQSVVDKQQRSIESNNVGLRNTENQHQQELTQKLETITVLEQQVRVKTEDLNAANEKSAEFQAKVEELEKECDDLRGLADEQRMSINDLNVRLQDIQNLHKQQFEENRREQSRETQEAVAIAELAERKYREAQELVNELRADLVAKSEEINSLRQQAEQMKDVELSPKWGGKDAEKLRLDLDTALSELGHAQAESESLRQQVVNKEMELQQLQNNIHRQPSTSEHTALLIDESPASAPVFGGMTNKKDEDLGDVEGAMLTGGDHTGFQPLAGLVKRAPLIGGWGSCIKAATYSDRASVALLRRPALRAALLFYILVVHLAFLL